LRHEDISFINANTGWAISSYGINSTAFHFIFKTTDGGISWIDQADTSVARNFRCMGFADSLNGWVGSLSLNGPEIIRTTNGGQTWISSLSTPNADSNNVCGISVVNKNLVYACGRYYGPPRFYKTTNGGVDWTIKDMSPYARTLVDCYFYSKDSGFVVGGGAGSFPNTKGIVLFTSDGGDTWVTRHTTVVDKQWGWKISFPSSNVGYISLESINNPQSYILKTTNGGVNWQEKLFLNQQFDEEGIGFINETTGWLGGWSAVTHKTTNGGDTWFPDAFGENMNRFRFINDSLGNACGKRVYRYSRDSLVGISLLATGIPDEFELKQNFPNPFNPGTKIRFDIVSTTAEIRLEVYNSLGQMVETLVNGKMAYGSYEVEFSANKHPAGVYYYRLLTNNFTETKKMMLVK
jgi:photosystem II stability/assembly factor-like uncharacterized protein